MMSQNAMQGKKFPKQHSRNMLAKPRQLDLLNQAKNMGQIRPKSRGQIRPKSRGQIRPKSRGQIRPKSKGQIRPKTCAKSGQKHGPNQVTTHWPKRAKITGQVRPPHMG